MAWWMYGFRDGIGSFLHFYQRDTLGGAFCRPLMQFRVKCYLINLFI